MSGARAGEASVTAFLVVCTTERHANVTADLKDVAFHNWAIKYCMTDAVLCIAAGEIENGLVEARLGGFLLKKRVAVSGRGKRSRYRTIVGYREAD